MDTMNAIVAKNIRRLREENRLSMEELAKLSGVSKSMLAQIERGDGNPTISTLWKISNGMKVPFDALTVRPKASYEIVKTSDIQPILEDGERFAIIRFFRTTRTGGSRSIIWSWSREQLAVGAPSVGNEGIYHRVFRKPSDPGGRQGYFGFRRGERAVSGGYAARLSQWRGGNRRFAHDFV